MSEYIERYWRDATPADAIKEPPMVARFRDEDDKEWLIGKLFGFDRSRKYKWCGETRDAIKCQVYDTPDPGEGWRLIDLEKDKPQEGDEVWAGYKWSPMQYFMEFFLPNHYRRRIEQLKPESKYEPFRWEDREQLRGRWIVDSTGEQEYTIDDFLNDDGVLYICGHPAEYFLNWKFMDTGEPVGRKVTQ